LNGIINNILFINFRNKDARGSVVNDLLKYICFLLKNELHRTAGSLSQHLKDHMKLSKSFLK